MKKHEPWIKKHGDDLPVVVMFEIPALYNTYRASSKVRRIIYLYVSIYGDSRFLVSTNKVCPGD